MKKQILIVSIALICAICTQSVQAQHFYVKVQPVAPVVVRPAPPSPHHVWVEDEWVWRNGSYAHVPGYWATPRPHYHRWVPGHWRHYHSHGYYWVPGHWA